MSSSILKMTAKKEETIWENLNENVNDLQFPFVNSICTMYDYRLHINRGKIARIPILIKIILLFVFAIELILETEVTCSKLTIHKRNTNPTAENKLKIHWHCGCVSMSFANVEFGWMCNVKHKTCSKVHTNTFQFANIDSRTEKFPIFHFQFNKCVNVIRNWIQNLKPELCACECVWILMTKILEKLWVFNKMMRSLFFMLSVICKWIELVHRRNWAVRGALYTLHDDSTGARRSRLTEIWIAWIGCTNYSNLIIR